MKREKRFATRERIKRSAADEFIRRGFDGARMQAIADRAGANKAMIYYYFRSKEALFEAIIREAFEELFGLLSKLSPDSRDDPEILIPGMVRMHLRFLAEHPHLPKLMVREIHAGHPLAVRVLGEMIQKIKKTGRLNLAGRFRSGVRAGKIRNTDPEQTLWNIVALNLFYFIAKPVLEAGWPEEFRKISESTILKKRERAVTDLVLHGLLPRK
ncbi:TetR family transcriptional regulator [bacterium]|nr:TetR family transcriptional regulator [bacterium]